jgi:DNA-binding transcriptional regulator YdaS (Cro superfamily)
MMHIHVMTDDAALTPLAKWMKSRDLRDQWLADALEITQPQACRIRRGDSRTSPERAFQIEKITKGAVKASDVLLPREAA